MTFFSGNESLAFSFFFFYSRFVNCFAALEIYAINLQCCPSLGLFSFHILLWFFIAFALNMHPNSTC